MDAVFRGGVPRVPCPWPRLGATRTRPAPSRLVTAEMVQREVRLVEVDPRILWCSQGWVVLEHARYYTTGRWERTGVTSADRHVVANRFPLVVRDDRDRFVIVAGHHRSLAALVMGRRLLCRLMPDGTDSAVALTPHLLVGAATALSAVRCDTAMEACAIVGSGRRALVPTADIGRAAHRALIDDENVRR